MVESGAAAAVEEGEEEDGPGVEFAATEEVDDGGPEGAVPAAGVVAAEDGVPAEDVAAEFAGVGTTTSGVPCSVTCAATGIVTGIIVGGVVPSAALRGKFFPYNSINCFFTSSCILLLFFSVFTDFPEFPESLELSESFLELFLLPFSSFLSFF